MGIEVGDKKPIKLSGDEARTFYVRTLKARAQRQVISIVGNFAGAEDKLAAMEAVEQCVADNLVGWDGVQDEHGNSIPFDASKVGDVLDIAEEVELLGALIGFNRVSDTDLKKSE